MSRLVPALALLSALVKLSPDAAAQPPAHHVARSIPGWDSLPSPLINLHVTSGAGHSQACYRTAKGAKARYFCRDLASDGYNGTFEVPIAGTTAIEVATGNYTVTYHGPTARSIDGVGSVVTGEMYEGCARYQATPGGYLCKYEARNVSVKTYGRGTWAYYGSALKSTFVNTGTAASCLYGLYHLDPDITGCL